MCEATFICNIFWISPQMGRDLFRVKIIIRLSSSHHTLSLKQVVHGNFSLTVKICIYMYLIPNIHIYVIIADCMHGAMVQLQWCYLLSWNNNFYVLSLDEIMICVSRVTQHSLKEQGPSNVTHQWYGFSKYPIVNCDFHFESKSSWIIYLDVKTILNII